MATKIARIQLSDGRIARIQVEVPDEVSTQLKLPSLAEKTSGILEQIPSPIPSLSNIFPATEQADFPAQISQTTKDIGMGTVMPPQALKAIAPFERGGQLVKKQVGSITGAPEWAMGLAPFTPSEFSSEIASSIMPAIPFAGKGAKMAKNIANKFLGTSSKLLERDIKRGAKTLGERLLEKGLNGSREEVFNKAIKETDVLENKIQDVLKTISKEEGTARFSTITKKEVAEVFDTLKKEYNPEFDQADIRKIGQLKEQFLKLNKDKTINEWMDLKRSLYKQIGNINYLKDTHTTKIETKIAVAKRIRELTEKVIPEIKQLNREQGDLIEITNSLGKTLSKGESSITKALFGDIEQSALLKGARALKPIGKGKYVAPLLRGQAGNVPRLVTNE